jgi:hypothetical protein
MTDEATIKRALRLMRAGRATMAEVAHLAGTSRQLVAHWAQRAGVDPIAARRAYLERLWRL